jgi:hypothetical protein
MPDDGGKVRLDLNNPVFQAGLFGPQKAEWQAALETLNKLRRLTWQQVHRDAGLKWEKISSVKPPPASPRSIRCGSPARGAPRPIATARSSVCSASRPIMTAPTGIGK